MFIADCIEYGQFRNGARNQGIAFATKAFTNKIIVALTGAFAMFGLAAAGFIEGEGAAQSQATMNGIWFLYSFMPLIGSSLAMVIMLAFYKLREADVDLMIRCNRGEITRKEAEARFIKKF
jgi:Na+/melibiose symporter-like transporter